MRLESEVASIYSVFLKNLVCNKLQRYVIISFHAMNTILIVLTYVR